MKQNKHTTEKEEREDWFEENASHGAFALTQDEIDFYYKRNHKI